MNPLVERYVRHAKRFGDPQAAYRTARWDSLSATDLGYLAARLSRLDVRREANQFQTKRGRKRWPKFKLSRRQKGELVRRLLDEGVPVKTIATYLGATVRWVEDRAEYRQAVKEWVREVGIDHASLAIGPPVNLLDAANVSPSLYGVLTTILGYGSSSAKSTPDRLSTSGIGGAIVAVGLRFERLIVLRIERDGSGRKVAVCRCDCGTETTAKPSHLVRGEKRSCGCLRRERMAAQRRQGAAT